MLRNNPKYKRVCCIYPSLLAYLIMSVDTIRQGAGRFLNTPFWRSESLTTKTARVAAGRFSWLSSDQCLPRPKATMDQVSLTHRSPVFSSNQRSLGSLERTKAHASAWFSIRILQMFGGGSFPACAQKRCAEGVGRDKINVCLGQRPTKATRKSERQSAEGTLAASFPNKRHGCHGHVIIPLDGSLRLLPFGFRRAFT